jgi:hypothetical protein
MSFARNRRPQLSAVAACLALAACAGAPVERGVPVSVAQQPIAPWETHEACADVVAGDRVDFNFDATRPVDLDVYYRQGAAVIIPLSRRGVVADGAVLEVRIPGRYCLAFKAGAEGALVSYRITIHPASG